MRVISIDPGYDRLGVAVLEKESAKEVLLFSDCIQTNKKDDFADRLFAVVYAVEQIIDEYTPDIFAIEKLFFNTNQKTAMQVAQVIGALLYLAKKQQLPVYEYTPLQIKVAVAGNGRGSKTDVIAMLHHLIPINKKIALDDEYDAIAVGLTCLVSQRIR